EHERPRRRVDALAVELERRAPSDHDVELLVPELLLGVLLDHAPPRAGGVRVDAEGTDSECLPDRPPDDVRSLDGDLRQGPDRAPLEALARHANTGAWSSNRRRSSSRGRSWSSTRRS